MLAKARQNLEELHQCISEKNLIPDSLSEWYPRKNVLIVNVISLNSLNKQVNSLKPHKATVPMEHNFKLMFLC